MPEEFRESIYWGAGSEGRWYREQVGRQVERDSRFNESRMKFIRYAVKYCLEHDPSLKKK